MKKPAVMGFLLSWLLCFSLSLVETPDPAVIYKEIKEGRIPSVVYPIATNKENENKITFDLSPNYYITNFETMSISSWFSVVYDASTPLNIFNDLPPLSKLTFHFSRKEAAIHIEIFARRSYNAFLKWPDSTMPFIYTPPYVSLDSSFPYDSYIAYKPNDWFEFYIGRTKISWGYWDYPVSISPSAPYFDNMTFKLNFGGVRYTYTLVSINPILTPQEYETQHATNVTNSDLIDPYDEKVKTLVSKRLDFILSDNFRWSIGELGMVGGKVPDIYTLNPAGIVHNLYDAAYLNVIGTLQAAWTPVKGFNLYFDFALDDFAVPLTEPPNAKPTAFALSTGAFFAFKVFNFPILLNLNYSYASKWVYNTFLPYLKFDSRYIILSNFPVPARVIYSYPIGFKYGPDSQLYSVKLSSGKEDLKISAELFYLEKGKFSILSDYKDDSEDEIIKYIGFKLNAELKCGFGGSLYVLNNWYHLGGYYKISF